MIDMSIFPLSLSPSLLPPWLSAVFCRDRPPIDQGDQGDQAEHEDQALGRERTGCVNAYARSRGVPGPAARGGAGRNTLVRCVKCCMFLFLFSPPPSLPACLPQGLVCKALGDQARIFCSAFCSASSPEPLPPRTRVPVRCYPSTGSRLFPAFFDAQNKF